MLAGVFGLFGNTLNHFSVESRTPVRLHSKAKRAKNDALATSSFLPTPMVATPATPTTPAISVMPTTPATPDNHLKAL